MGASENAQVENSFQTGRYMDDYVVYKLNFAESSTDNGLKPSFLTGAVSITQ